MRAERAADESAAVFHQLKRYEKLDHLLLPDLRRGGVPTLVGGPTGFTFHKSVGRIKNQVGLRGTSKNDQRWYRYLYGHSECTVPGVPLTPLPVTGSLK